jgi:hypothetical protein
VKAFVDWVLAQRLRPVVLGVVAASLLPNITAALLALETARRGPLQGALSAAAGIGALLLLALVIPQADLARFATTGLLGFGTGVVIGELMRRAGNLSFAFQSVVLLCFATVFVVVAFGPDPSTLFASVIAEFAAMMREAGMAEDEIAFVVDQAGAALLAPVVVLLFVVPLVIAYWWLTLATGQRRFGAEFRGLTLGRWLGGLATLLILPALVFAAPLVQNLRSLALFAFLFQGLAVLHAAAHAKRWHVAIVAGVYVSMVVPLVSPLTLLTLSAVGLIDNWFNLRARFLSQAKE